MNPSVSSVDAGVDQERGGAGTIAVCIVCRNEADRLRPCLASVGWADELIVMDLNSDDGSAQVAHEYGARVLQREPLPIVEPLRNELAAATRCSWVLAVDPDERVTPGLARSLQEVAGQPDLDAVIIPRMNYDLGVPPTHPMHRYEPQLRMYRPDRVRWPEVPNELPQVAAERTLRLPLHDDVVLVHDRSRNVPEIVERISRYAPAQAQSMLESGQTFSVRAMFGALVAQAEKEFLHAEPWHDGVSGLLRAGILVAYKFYVWTALWQLSEAKGDAADERWLHRASLFLRAVRWLVVARRRLHKKWHQLRKTSRS